MGDVIYLERLEAKCVIGIFDWERKIKQRVWMDLTIPVNARKAAATDSLKNTVDYKRLAKRASSFVSQSRFQLIETLAEKLGEVLIREFSLAWLRIRISKPGAVRGSKNVSIEIDRRAPREKHPRRMK